MTNFGKNAACPMPGSFGCLLYVVSPHWISLFFTMFTRAYLIIVFDFRKTGPPGIFLFTKKNHYFLGGKIEDQYTKTTGRAPAGNDQILAGDPVGTEIFSSGKGNY